ncbi:Alpha/Beta hydrolase protein [Hysterangium stoloniferum]|nr:Alpha/Beta hydrolase protein [Hysterangium stoloniferum]
MDAAEWHSDVFAGTTYRYLVSNPTNSQPWCLLLHGHPGCSFSWRHTVVFLRNHGYGIILPDMLGYGGTDKPLEIEQYRPSRIVKSIAAMLDHVVVDGRPVIVLAHDWGSPIATRLYLRNPGKIQALVLLTFPYFPPSETTFDFAGFNSMFREHVDYDIIDYFKFFSSPEAANLLTQNIDTFLTIVFAKDTPNIWKQYWANGGGMRTALLAGAKFEIADYMSDKDIEVYKNELGDGNYSARLNWYKSFFFSIQQKDDLDLLDRRHIHIPTIFFQALRDAVCIPPVASAQSHFIDDLTVVDIDSDHFIMECKPNEFHSALLAWFKEKEFAINKSL